MLMIKASKPLNNDLHSQNTKFAQNKFDLKHSVI